MPTRGSRTGTPLRLMHRDPGPLIWRGWRRVGVLLVLLGAAGFLAARAYYSTPGRHVRRVVWKRFRTEAGAGLLAGMYPADHRRFSVVHVGMTGDEVRRHLGEPASVARRNEDLRYAGYPRPPHPVTHRAYAYLGSGGLLCVVYLSRQGRVEHVFLAGS